MSKVSSDRNSSKNLVKITRIILLIGIILTSCFIIYEIINVEPGYITLGLLNSEGNAEDYPTTAKVGESVSFYVTVQNFMKKNFTFQLEISKGNNQTILNSTGSFNAKSYFNTTEVTLIHSEFWISEMLNVSFSQPGANQSIIVELWEIPNGGVRKFFEITYIRLHILT